jgi:hypothetical protein
MKMAHKNQVLRSKVVTILEELADFWDEDIQQRSMEYLQMLK